MRAVVTGATGLIGKALVAKLERPIVLSRNPEAAKSSLRGVEVRAWNPDASTPDVAGADVVFQLAGEPIAEGRWTVAKKRRIHDSRVVGTRNLVAGIAAASARPKVLVSGSAVGYYGDRGEERLDENSPAGSGFLADVCREWEAAALAARSFGVRVVTIRTGVVLARNGGALAKMLPPFRMGVGGRLASGQQWMPWIHLDDLVALFLFAARTETLSGPVNGVAPEPATNAVFTRALASTLHRPAIFPVPQIALRLAFGEMSEILLASQRVLPRAAQDAGFTYRYPKLDGALGNLLGR